MDIISLKPLYWLLLLLPLVMFFAKSLVNRPKTLKLLSFLLRTAGIILLIWVLCGPYLFESTKSMHVVFLLDTSESVDLNNVKHAITDIQQKIKSLQSNDSYSIYFFADDLRETNLKDLQKLINDWQAKLADDSFRKSTQIASSTNAAKLVFPADKIKEIFLYSDGMNTSGALEKTLNNLKRDHITLRHFPIARISFPEAAVLSLKASSDTAYSGEMIRLTTELAANCDMTARVRFINRGIVLKEIPIKLSKDKTEKVTSDFIVNDDIRDIWEAEIIPEKDHFPINNKATCAVQVKGTPKILVIHKKPTDVAEFIKALKKQGIEVEARGKFGLPENIPEMLEFDAIILSDIPAMDLNSRQMNNIKRYVMDFGRGFIMTGSENSFGLGGYYKTPVEDVLPVVSRYEKEKEQPSLAMVLVIDKSGSMNGMPIELAREAAKATVELLSSRDQIGVVAFDGEAHAVCDMTSAVNSVDIQGAIDSIGAGGGTNMYPAMGLGKEMLEKSHSKIKHMILLTDGQSQAGDFEGLASEMGDLGMTVSTVALGEGSARELLSRIAELGRGRYYETNDYEAMPKIFTKETMEASRSAIKEEPFLPVKIGDADYLQGIDFDNIPFLLGYVMTRAKPTVKVQLLTEQGDPLLATGRFGLGQSASFTSDISKKWAGEWLDWKDFGKFWSQIIRSILKSSSAEGFATRITEENNYTNVIIKRIDNTGQPLNNIKWDAQLFIGNSSGKPLTISEIGLGLYQLTYKTPELGNYTLQLTDTSYNKSKTIHKQQQYPKEYLLGNTPPKAIQDLPKLTAGPITIERQPINTRKYFGNVLNVIAMLLIIAGIFLRRI